MPFFPKLSPDSLEKREISKVLLLLVGLLPLLGSPVISADYRVSFSSTTVYPGDTLRVEIDAITPDVQTRVILHDKSYAAFPIGPNAQRALIGIPLGSKPGRLTLRVRPKSAPEHHSFAIKEFAIDIASRSYAIETVSFTAQKTALMKLDHKESTHIHKLLLVQSSEQLWEGNFDPPVQGKKVGEYGVKRVANGSMDRGFHRGIDLGAKAGTPILAPNSGFVIYAYPFRMHGRTVILNHGQGITSIYLHMKSFSVKPGQKVVKGQEIGKVGSTGLSTAPHVHWGVYVHGVAVDPDPWTNTEF